MKIKFAGAAGEVTGSKHLITFNGKKILLDCGMFQGHRKEERKKNSELLFDPDDLDAVILSHAHIDHSGILPLLAKRGYGGPIYCTHATRDLSNYMLSDSAYIQEREVEWLKKRKKLPKVLREPLYRLEDAEDILKNFYAVNYEQSFVVESGIVASFYDAGHILGSALIHMIFYDKKSKKHLRLCFTGDLGRRGLPILRDPQSIPPTDVLITECTYGNRLHAALQTIEDDLAAVVNKVCEDGGVLIIPSFALERAQEVVYYLNLLNKKKKIPKIPIFVDSPLAGNLTEVFRSHMECFDKETRDEFIKQGDNPFGFGELKYTRSVDESKALNDMKGPMVIISASGMCEHGRILHHLKNNIEDPKNVVLIVGYQAENTLGRKLADGHKEVNIFGDPYKVRAKVYMMDAFSAHADRSDLLDYIDRIEGPKKTFLVHGEQTQLEFFSNALFKNGYKDVHIPHLGEEVEIDFDELGS
ncbi:MBL fold metallo-hydrolase [Candidatus Peregrinibacteria bacterium]|nr:MBL fold metallo-hydrolase [Candidatus Peregrinibacteria bacterium]